jgi:LmbE family N-acetylglucosaminyl deacetylase
MNPRIPLSTGLVACSIVGLAIVGSSAFVSGQSGPTKPKGFCDLAKTSKQGRTQREINEYYQQLEAVSTPEIRSYVTTLRNGWNKVGIPFEELGSGHVDHIQRSEQVTAAAKKVASYVHSTCGTEASGVYLIFPDQGYSGPRYEKTNPH